MSGGADSLALLALASVAGLAVTAVHVDHGLRPGSAEEADVVRDAAVRFGARFVAERVAVAAGPNLEARARAARAEAVGPAALTGHTADDLAETVLLNLIRGAGLAGLASMSGDPRRPLLALRRAETLALCAELDLVAVRDPSNLDPAFRRNRVRHELVPLLDDIAERDVRSVLARQAALVRDDECLLSSLAAALDPTDARALGDAPLPLARRAVRRWLLPELGRWPTAAEVARVMAVASGEAAACEVGGGRRVSRSGGRLRLGRR